MSFARLFRVVFSVGVAALLGLLAVPACAQGVFVYDWVTVGDPGNAADTTGYGACAPTTATLDCRCSLTS